MVRDFERLARLLSRAEAPSLEQRRALEASLRAHPDHLHSFRVLEEVRDWFGLEDPGAVLTVWETAGERIEELLSCSGEARAELLRESRFRDPRIGHRLVAVGRYQLQTNRRQSAHDLYELADAQALAILPRWWAERSASPELELVARMAAHYSVGLHATEQPEASAVAMERARRAFEVCEERPRLVDEIADCEQWLARPPNWGDQRRAQWRKQQENAHRQIALLELLAEEREQARKEVEERVQRVRERSEKKKKASDDSG